MKLHDLKSRLDIWDAHPNVTLPRNTADKLLLVAERAERFHDLVTMPRTGPIREAKGWNDACRSAADELQMALLELEKTQP